MKKLLTNNIYNFELTLYLLKPHFNFGTSMPKKVWRNQLPSSLKSNWGDAKFKSGVFKLKELLMEITHGRIG